MDLRSHRSVEGLLRRDFISLDEGESQHAAQQLMSLARVRHLPVLRGGTLVGLLSNRDLLQRLLEQRDAELPGPALARLRDQSIGSVVRSDPMAVEPSCPPRRAAELMLRHRIGFLPVVESGPAGPRLIGILTESDLLRAVYRSRVGGG